MRVVALTPEYEIKGFDCGDSDLNEFLLQDAKHFSEKRIANTFVLEDEGKIVDIYEVEDCIKAKGFQVSE